MVKQDKITLKRLSWPIKICVIYTWVNIGLFIITLILALIGAIE